MKFLILWRFEIAGLRAEMVQAIARTPDYAPPVSSSRASSSPGTTSSGDMAERGSMT